MENTYKLIWSDEALTNLKNIISYLENRWTKKEINRFSKLIDRQLKFIQDNPLLFSESAKSRGLRKSVLSKQTTIYYRIIKLEVHIVALFDNRQNPNKGPKL